MSKGRKPVTFYTEYDEKVLFERIEGLVNPFKNYVKSRKNLDDDYYDSEYNPSDKEIYRQINLIMDDWHDGTKTVRLLIEYGNGHGDFPIFVGNEKKVRAWVASLSVQDVYEKVIENFERWGERP